MARWADMAAARPDLAKAGEALFRAFTVGYLATLRQDGAPRIHPVTVTLHEGGLYICAVAGKAKAADLSRDGRYALHRFPRFPTEQAWDDEEFTVAGVARRVEDRGVRESVLAVHNDTVAEDDALFELHPERAFHKWRPAGALRHETWRDRAPT
jgi:hypothetical protein